MKDFLRNKFVIAVIAVIIAALFVHIFLMKENVVFIENVYERSFNDSIFAAYSKKYGGEVIAVTKLKACDTPVVINGISKDLGKFYIELASGGMFFSKRRKPTVFI